MNAAVWLGAGVFFTFGVGPAFFTPEMKQLLGPAYPGLIAQMVMERYFALQYWCGSIAIVHLLAEWVYLGKALHRITLGAILTAFCLGLIGGVWFQPKIKRLHQVKYGRVELYTPAQKTQAAKSLGVWHGTSMIGNYLALAALAVSFWRLANPANGPRFVPANKFRG